MEKIIPTDKRDRIELRTVCPLTIWGGQRRKKGFLGESSYWQSYAEGMVRCKSEGLRQIKAATEYSVEETPQGYKCINGILARWYKPLVKTIPRTQRD
jgi:hypothetical protein